MKPLIQSIRKFAAAGIAVASFSLRAGSALAQQGPGVTTVDSEKGW